MKVRTALMGVGAALMMVLAAQSAQAQSCNNGGGGGSDQQIEVTPGDGEPCQPMSGWSSTTFEAENANGVSYTVDLSVNTGSEYLAIGEYVEVDIDYDDVMAALRSDHKNAVALAAEVGIRPSMKGAVSHASNKLTEAEYHALATYVKISVQNSGRSTGRSDSAVDGFVRRVDAAAQAFGRAMDAIGRNIPNFTAGLGIRINYPNGQTAVEVNGNAEVRRNN